MKESSGLFNTKVGESHMRYKKVIMSKPASTSYNPKALSKV